MVSSVSSHRLYHKRTLLLCVQSSGNPCKDLFACSLITNHNMSTAAEINKKWGEGVLKTKLEFPVLLPPPPPRKHKQSKAVSPKIFWRVWMGWTANWQMAEILTDNRHSYLPFPSRPSLWTPPTQSSMVPTTKPTRSPSWHHILR